MNQSPYDASQLLTRAEVRIEVLERRLRQLLARNTALESDIKRLREHLRDYVETEDTLTENLDESRVEIEKLKNKVAELENIIKAQNHVKELEREVKRLRVASTNLLSLHLRALEGDAAEQSTWDDAIFRLHTSLVGLPE